METIPGIIQRNDIVDEISNKLNIEFTIPEHDLILLQMYRQNYNIKKLPVSPLINFLERICSKVIAEEEVQQENVKEPGNEYEEEYNEEEEKFEDVNIPSRFPVKEQYKNSSNGIPSKFPPKEEPNKEQSEDKYEAGSDFEDDFESEESEAKEDFGNITQEQMIDIAQKVFFNLANAMLQGKMTVRKLFSADIIKQTFNGEEMEVIVAENFIQGINNIGLTNLQPIEYACLIKVLAVNDEGEFIKVEDLMQILADYGIKENNESDKGKPKDLLNLDKFSMILLLALTEYLLKSNTPLYELFEEKIKQEKIIVKSKERKVELMESKDFFEVLASIGIQLEDDENEDLKKALSFNHKQFANKISVKKLKNAIEQFAFNDELRKKAQDCYEEFVEEEELLEREDHGTIKEQPE